jgi:hypothetical protein
MIERDYIMRMLQDFFTMIAKLMRLKVEEPDTTLLQERFYDVYKQFFRKPADYFYALDKEDIPDELTKDNMGDAEHYAMVQMLAELLYQDGLIKKDVVEKIALLEKSFYLFQYIDNNSKTYSWDRLQKMSDINILLTEYEIVKPKP